MGSGEEREAVSPRVVFEVSSILYDLNLVGAADERIRQVEELCRRVISDSLEQVMQVMPTVSLNASYCRLGRNAGPHDLMYSLEEVRRWCGTAADLVELGSFGQFIVRRLSAEVGEQKRYAVFSQEILEGMCLCTLQEDFGIDVRDARVDSEGFETWYGKGSRAEGLTHFQVYLVWANVNEGSYQFLIDCNGSIWRQYWVNHETGGVERVG